MFVLKTFVGGLFHCETAKLLHLKTFLGVLLSLFGQDDNVLPNGSELLLEHLDHHSLLSQILQLLEVAHRLPATILKA